MSSNVQCYDEAVSYQENKNTGLIPILVAIFQPAAVEST